MLPVLNNRIEGAVCMYEALSAFLHVSPSNMELERFGMSLKMVFRSKITPSQTPPPLTCLKMRCMNCFYATAPWRLMTNVCIGN